MQNFCRLFFFVFLAQFALPAVHSAPLTTGQEEAVDVPNVTSPALIPRAGVADWLFNAIKPAGPAQRTNDQQGESHKKLGDSTNPTLYRLAYGYNRAMVPTEDVLTAEEKEVFMSDIGDIVFGQEIGGGLKNAGVWDVTSYKGQTGLIAKFLNHDYARYFGVGEVKALAMMGDLIASGLTKHPSSALNSQAQPVIIMRKKHGKTCDDLKRTKGVTDDQCRDALCKKVAQDTIEKHLYHDDNHSDNGYFEFLENNIFDLFGVHNKGIRCVEVIDYGSAYKVIRQDVKKEEYYKACMGQ
ncbi:hypothetical protein C8R42DRAFT_657320 [Lentinula raphanica]|nr:hypothetical protein C8R42DRAFT_657320 [Lentinula raphanica]